MLENPHPQEITIPFVGGMIGYSGTAQQISTPLRLRGFQVQIQDFEMGGGGGEFL